MIITAIYDKKARTLGRPIFQQNVEEAIRGISDALNSKTTAGEWLMPGHREHQEDYCLVLLGHFDQNAYDTIDFDKNGQIIKKETKCPIEVEERIIIEFKDIELKEVESKINWATINENMAKAFQDFGQLLKQNLDNLTELHKKTLEGIELLTNNKNTEQMTELIKKTMEEIKSLTNNNKKKGFWH